MKRNQEQAIAFFRRFLEQKVERSQESTKIEPLVLTKFEVTETNYGSAWISAQLERTGLPETSLLRALDHEYWHVHVGVRGGLAVHSAPRQYEQFSSRRAFGMKFKLRAGSRKYKQQPTAE
jgi:hypothetical protein